MDHKLPELVPEHELIRERHSTLVSTGCTEEFCAVGQVNITNERRVGENRAVDVVEQEAEEFLRELHNEKFFHSEVDFQERLKTVRLEIRNSSVEGVICETQGNGVVGGTWTQTPQELEFGIRRAWRNARKCIMRSHCEDLKLCDLRSVKRSNVMAVELVKGLTEAYNGGKIIPTVFVFPPRATNKRGPMIWNDQLLSFAGYEAEDGTIIGDPKNVQLTKDIVELGWKPPKLRSRWDVLPVVVMAEDDGPAFIELPANLRKLVKIQHPRYEAAFEKLDLNWVAFPALSRLGFDIGGVQYTATPFIGWFMDTEIGIRDLANPLRYNILPELIMALNFNDKTAEHPSFKNLAAYELLAMLSRAQIELNYAIYHSFLREGITMSDSLSASKNWIQYDDEFEKQNGYRLPSDLYSLAPPQGSIIPVWHREDAPNYQPKPLICWHAQDPIDVWRVEKSEWTPVGTIQPTSAQSPTESLCLDLKDREKPVSTLSRVVEETGPSISDVKAHPSDDAPSLELSSPSVSKSLDEAKSREKPETPMDEPLPPNRMRSYSLTSGWGPLMDPAETPEPAPSTGADNPSNLANTVRAATSAHISALTLRRTRAQSFFPGSMVAVDKTLAASEYFTKFSQQYDPFTVVKDVWPVVCIPTILMLALCLKLI
ncbi:nitric oxide synthase [Collybia nuda]|uniref:nitric-oxide synthase (NADPH) n=1 Tax=Collybia nuda TaxID=64659 RepID=A0A9P6CE37_9AGAR|nr:nitric oxide synthase [Collybia nuda]